MPITTHTIDRLSPRGRGIADKTEICHTVPGDQVLANKRGRKKAFLAGILQPGPDRTAPRCKHVGACGGCSLQQLDYEAQLGYKQKRIEEAFPGHSIDPIISCDDPWHYRNKMEFSFSQDKAGTRFLGLMKPGAAGRVVSLKTCHIAPAWFSEVLCKVGEWWKQSGLEAYHPPKNQGTLRNLTIREGRHTGDRLVMLSVSDDADVSTLLDWIEEPLILQRVIAQKGIPTQTIETILRGPGLIREVLLGAQFEIAPTAFLQPNTLQAERLYQIALDGAGLSESSRVYDLYCGAGTIGILAAKRAGRVTGVEIHPPAVAAAQRNIALNKLNNIEIFQGDVGELEGEPCDVAFVDPPRAGLSPQAIKQLLATRAKKIVYISCNPATQAENSAQLTDGGYVIEKVQPVDQFPHTAHIENVVIFSKL